MATHSSTLAWRIPGTEEAGGLPSMGSHRVRHNCDLAAAAAAATSSFSRFYLDVSYPNFPHNSFNFVPHFMKMVIMISWQNLDLKATSDVLIFL